MFLVSAGHVYQGVLTPFLHILTAVTHDWCYSTTEFPDQLSTASEQPCNKLSTHALLLSLLFIPSSSTFIEPPFELQPSLGDYILGSSSRMFVTTPLPHCLLFPYSSIPSLMSRSDSKILDRFAHLWLTKHTDSSDHSMFTTTCCV